MLKKKTGNGGKTASLLKSPFKAQPKAPLAFATKPRQVRTTEFRYFYDRGDFPIAVEHGL
jgi:hypothetical protein